MNKQNNNEFFDALEFMEKEKGIPAEYLAEKIASAIVVSVKKDYGSKDVVFCDIDCDKRTFDVYVRKTAVEVEDPDTEMTVEEATRYKRER